MGRRFQIIISTPMSYMKLDVCRSKDHNLTVLVKAGFLLS
jgi:hypothetical protein